LQGAGLDSLPGGGAEILVDRVRQEISPHKISTDRWFEIMETAHGIGMHSTATMMFGSIETCSERIEHMIRVRDLQDRTGGFRAFIPWTFSPQNTALSQIEMAGGVEYLKTLAMSRIMIDNIPNIHAGWVTEGHKLAQVALAFGANDLGGTLLEEVVVKATGIDNQPTVAEMIDLIRSAGKIPAQRNTRYEILRTF
jgi:cyclic dehypoxanthinyl futalosine synthase